MASTLLHTAAHCHKHSYTQLHTAAHWQEHYCTQPQTQLHIAAHLNLIVWSALLRAFYPGCTLGLSPQLEADTLTTSPHCSFRAEPQIAQHKLFSLSNLVCSVSITRKNRAVDLNRTVTAQTRASYLTILPLPKGDSICCRSTSPQSSVAHHHALRMRAACVQNATLEMQCTKCISYCFVEVTSATQLSPLHLAIFGIREGTLLRVELSQIRGKIITILG